MSYIKVIRNDIIFLNMHRNYMFYTPFQRLWPIEILLILHQLQTYNFEKGYRTCNFYTCPSAKHEFPHIDGIHLGVVL
jgi:hypothetical protein